MGEEQEIRPRAGTKALLHMPDRFADVVVDRVGADDLVVRSRVGVLGTPEPGDVVALEWDDHGVDRVITLVVTSASRTASWVLERPGGVAHHREFFRATDVADVEVRLHGEVVRATMVDLSEAGVGLLIGRGLEPTPGDRLEVLIDTDDRQVPCDAEVRWTTPTEGGRWRVGAQLLRLASADEQRIRRRVLRAQVRGRR